MHFFNAGVNVKNCVVTWTDDGFVFNDDDLRRKELHVLYEGTSTDNICHFNEHSHYSSLFTDCPVYPLRSCWELHRSNMGRMNQHNRSYGSSPTDTTRHTVVGK